MKRLVTKQNNIFEMVMFPIYERRGKIALFSGLSVAVLLAVPSFMVDWVPTVYFLPAIFIILGAIRWRREHKNRSKIELG